MHTCMAKFRYAGQGLVHAFISQRSFHVHLPIGLLVLLLAVWLELEPWRWCGLVLCIGMVLSMELMNTAIELLVRVLHPEQDPTIGTALDTAAAAVLVAAIAAATVGLIILLQPLWASL